MTKNRLFKQDTLHFKKKNKKQMLQQWRRSWGCGPIPKKFFRQIWAKFRSIWLKFG